RVQPVNTRTANTSAIDTFPIPFGFRAKVTIDAARRSSDQPLIKSCHVAYQARVVVTLAHMGPSGSGHTGAQVTILHHTQKVLAEGHRIIVAAEQAGHLILHNILDSTYPSTNHWSASRLGLDQAYRRTFIEAGQ